MSSELSQMIDILVKEKGISREAVIEAIKQAVSSAAKKKLGVEDEDLDVRFDEKRGELVLYRYKEVVEQVEDPESQVSLKEAQEEDPEAAVGDVLGFKIDHHDFGDFGRIAAQNAKQVIIQRVKDAERLMVYDEYKDRVGELISGIVRRFERGNMIVDLGKPEAVLPHTEQVVRESYRVGDRIRAYIQSVQKESKGPQIILTRKNAEFVRKLFETEVPEISEGIVKIEAIAREAGVRTKIAVSSKDPDVDPVGACVGMKGSRVQAVVQELRGEKIDIIAWTKDIATNICNALAPAEISRMIIDDDQKHAQVVVSDDQLSLAIGKRGQNVRLAVQLTGWEIDIKSESEMKELSEKAQKSLGRIPGIGNIIAQKLYQEGFTTPKELAKADPELLVSLHGIGKVKAGKIIQAAKEFLEEHKAEIAQEEALETKAEEKSEDKDKQEGE
jgi:N utilization substance protein A